jgi:GNAT superfamily N-acetyltransferase
LGEFLNTMERSAPITVRPITAAETYPLRLAVLRPNGPHAAAQFPGDEAATTKHFGAFEKTELIGIASLFPAEMPGRPGHSALQLRGMATAPEVRGKGFGPALVKACVAYARDTGMKLIWCNARTSALGFYRKLGWEIVGDEFEIPGVGPHFHMWRPLQ